MRAYIAVSIKQRKSVYHELSAMTDILHQFKIEALVFVDVYQFDSSEEKQMMKQAMTEIDQCEILIAETSDKTIGVGIEVGYAKAKGKTVIYVRNQKAEHSTTVSGISDLQLIYHDVHDLRKQLVAVLNEIVTKPN